MNIPLSPALQRFIEDKIAGGFYATPGEVIRAALRLLQAHEGGTSRAVSEPQTVSVKARSPQPPPARRIVKGIRRTQSGWQVFVKIRGKFVSRHFPPNTPMEQLRRTWAQLRGHRVTESAVPTRAERRLKEIQAEWQRLGM